MIGRFKMSTLTIITLELSPADRLRYLTKILDSFRIAKAILLCNKGYALKMYISKPVQPICITCFFFIFGSYQSKKGDKNEIESLYQGFYN